MFLPTSALFLISIICVRHAAFSQQQVVKPEKIAHGTTFGGNVAYPSRLLICFFNVLRAAWIRRHFFIFLESIHDICDELCLRLLYSALPGFALYTLFQGLLLFTYLCTYVLYWGWNFTVLCPSVVYWIITKNALHVDFCPTPTNKKHSRFEACIFEWQSFLVRRARNPARRYEPVFQAHSPASYEPKETTSVEPVKEENGSFLHIFTTAK